MSFSVYEIAAIGPCPLLGHLFPTLRINHLFVTVDIVRKRVTWKKGIIKLRIGMHEYAERCKHGRSEDQLVHHRYNDHKRERERQNLMGSVI